MSLVQRWNSILLACYAGGLLVTSPVCGFLIDYFASPRLPFVLGLVALAGSTALLCIGSSTSILLLGRVLEGVSGAVIWTSGTALIVDTVGETEVGNVIGYSSLSVNIAIVLGPAIGGIVFDRSGYYAVFAIAFGLIAVDALLRLLLVEKKVAFKWNSDFKKNISCYWTYLYDEEGTPSFAATSKMKSLSDFESILKMKFPENPAVNLQKTLPAPNSSSQITNTPLILLLRSRRLLTALWASLVQAAVLSAFGCILPIYVHRTFGWSSTGAGLIFFGNRCSIFWCTPRG
jgi:MFS family permease